MDDQRFFNDGTSFVALLCTFSIAVISLILYGLQSALVYSKCGLTSTLYYSRKVSSSRHVKVLHMRPIVLLIFSLMWCSNVSLLLMVTPMSFSFSTCSRVVLLGFPSTNRTIYLNRKQSILTFIEYLPMNILKE
jgi:hypothetical protein